MNVAMLFRRRTIITGLLITVCISVSSFATYLLTRPSQKPTTQTNPAATFQMENDTLIAQVRSLVVTPDEQPTIATIQNKETLIDQPFFQNAQNGDKVLYFANAKKAIIYRPTDNKIVDISSVETAPKGPTPTPTIGLTQKIQVAILNGTATPRQASVMEQVVTTLFPTADVIVKGNAENQDPGYEKTMIINLTNQNDQVLTAFTNAIGAQISTLPTGEKKPLGDILIIIGKDFIKKE